jgi:hypothetical protein
MEKNMPATHETIDAVKIEQPRVRVLPDGRMTREDAATYLGHKPKTLAMWQLQGRGPRSVLVGGRRVHPRRGRLDAPAQMETPPCRGRRFKGICDRWRD